MANKTKPKTNEGNVSTPSATQSGLDLSAMVATLLAKIEALEAKQNGSAVEVAKPSTKVAKLNGDNEWSPETWSLFKHVNLQDVTDEGKATKIRITKIALTRHTTMKANYVTRTLEEKPYVKIHALAEIKNATVTFDVSETSHIGTYIRNAYFDEAGKMYSPNRIYDTPIEFHVTRSATNNARVPFKYVVTA